jgi:stage II sporulation protein P
MKRRFRANRTSGKPHMHLFVIITSIILATGFVLAGWIEMYRTSHSNRSTQFQSTKSVPRYLNPQWVDTIFDNVLPFYQPHNDGTFLTIINQPYQTLIDLASRFLTTMTDLDPRNLWSLLSTQIPVLHTNGFLLHTETPSDVAKYTNPPSDTNDTTPAPDANGRDLQAPPSATEPQNQIPENEIPGFQANKPAIYIYHTHNRESFLPNLPQGLKDDQAYDPVINITEVGKRLMEDLNTRGITTIQTTNDYWKYGDYPYSRQTVEKELSKYPDLQMIFDIHRDSGPRDKTTTVINGQTVGRIFFIIGGSNPNYKQNLDFANRLNKKMEELYPANGNNPGLSEGIWVKQKNPKYDYDTTYNQDLNPNMVLIEIGGPYNSLDEVKRSADLLANVIQAVWQDEQNHRSN